MQNQPFVMIIEDAPEIVSIYVEILELKGMKVEAIMDGAVALERLAIAVPDLILLDIHLPNVSGLEILAYIRRTPHFQNSKVVAITANALLTDDLQDKVDLLLLKPVNVAQISELSARLLSNKTPAV